MVPTPRLPTQDASPFRVLSRTFVKKKKITFCEQSGHLKEEVMKKRRNFVVFFLMNNAYVNKD